MQNRLWSCVTHYRAFVTGCNRLSVFSRHAIQNPASTAQPQSCKTIWRPRLASIAPITIDESSKGRTLWPHHNSQRRHASILICKSRAFIQACEEFLPDVRCHHFFGIQHRRLDSALEPGQTRVGITPTNLIPPKSSGLRTINNSTTNTSINPCKSPSNAIPTAKYF